MAEVSDVKCIQVLSNSGRKTLILDKEEIDEIQKVFGIDVLKCAKAWFDMIDPPFCRACEDESKSTRYVIRIEKDKTSFAFQIREIW